MNKKTTRNAQGGGTIRKKTVIRDGKEYIFWEARVTVGHDAGTGKQLQKSFSGKTQKEVREKMQAAAVAVNQNDYFEPSKITFGKWLDTWLDEYCADLKYNTITHYRAMCETHIKPALGNVKLSAITAPVIQKFYNDLAKTGKKVTRTDSKGNKTVTFEPLSAKSIKNIDGIVKKALNVAVNLDMMRNNVAEKTVIAKVKKHEIQPLTMGQQMYFMQNVGEDKYSNPLKVIMLTGMREMECLGLTWDCVDFTNGVIKIEKQLLKTKGGFTFQSTKSDKIRIIKPARIVFDILKDQRKKQIEYRLAAAECWSGWQSKKEMEKALVFTDELGKNISGRGMFSRFKTIAKKAGCPDATIHDLRHTYAVLSLQNGDDVKTLQSNLGHATASFTLDVYGHVSEEMRKASADRMQAYYDAVLSVKTS